MNVAVIGAGIVGLATSLKLLKLGANVCLMEKNHSYGSSVSAVALGGLTPFSDDFIAQKLGVASSAVLESMQRMIGSLNVDLGEISYVSGGVIYAAFSQPEIERLCGPFSELFPHELRPQALSAKEVRNLAPSISKSVAGGVLVECEPALDPVRLMSSIFARLKSFENFDVRFGVDVNNVSEQGRVDYTEAGSPAHSEFDYVVICTGAGEFAAEQDERWKTKGVKGQCLVCSSPPERPHSLNHHVYAHIDHLEDFGVSAYVVPRDATRVVVGVTYETEYLDESSDVGGVLAVLKALIEMMPDARFWSVEEVKSGIRPVTADTGPLIGFRSKGDRGLLCLGHYGLGVTLAPYSADVIAYLLGLSAYEPPGVELFSPERGII